MPQTISRIDTALDAAFNLSVDEQEVLVDTLQHRISDMKRQEIAHQAEYSLKEFQSGSYPPLSAKEAISELNDYLSDESEA